MSLLQPVTHYDILTLFDAVQVQQTLLQGQGSQVKNKRWRARLLILGLQSQGATYPITYQDQTPDWFLRNCQSDTGRSSSCCSQWLMLFAYFALSCRHRQLTSTGRPASSTGRQRGAHAIIISKRVDIPVESYRCLKSRISFLRQQVFPNGLSTQLVKFH